MLRAAELVGRDGERLALTNLVQRARAGAGDALAIVGEAGIGKSALVRGALGDVGDALHGRATPPPSSPLRPLVELAMAAIARGARADDDRLRVHRAALATLLPGLALADGHTELPSPIHTADALLRLVRTLAPRPAVIVIEDLHWADTESLAAFEYLADRAGGGAVALIVTLRPGGEAETTVQRLHARRSLDVIRLGPLEPAGVASLAASCLHDTAPSGLIEALEGADGVPLLIEELLAVHFQRGNLTKEGDGWRFVPGGATVPPTVEATVTDRLGRIGVLHRRTVVAAALLGRDFDVAILPGALQTTPEQVDRALAAALEAGLLARDPATSRLRFTHAVVRDAVIHAAGPATTRMVAARLLDGMQASDVPPHQFELAAGLAVRADDQARAAALLVAVGRNALGLGLPGAAIRLLDQALTLLPPGEDALRVREHLVQALAAAGHADRTAEVGAVVQRQLAAVGADAGRRHACTIAIARAAANAGRWQEAETALYPLLELDPPPPSALALGASVALASNRFEEADHRAGLVLADPTAEPQQACMASEILGRLARRRDLDDALRHFEHAAATAELHGLRLERARAQHELATIDQLRTLGVAGLMEARDAAVAAAAPGLLAAVEFHIAAIHGTRFESAAALAAARSCLDTARRLGASHQQAWAWNLIAQGHAVGGDRPRARAAADEARRLAPDDAEIAGVAIGAGLALGSLLADDRDVALEQWSQSIAQLRRLPTPTPLPPWYLWPLLATVHDLEGDGGERARTETETSDLRVATGPDGLWHLAQAVAAGHRGDVEGANRAAAVADARFVAMPAFAGYIHLGRRVAAEAAISDGWGEPSAWLMEAAGWADGRGFITFEKACAALGRRAGLRQRRRGRGDSQVPEHLDRLGVTSREMDVLLLVADGLTNRQIAERLYVSVRTVKGHVESLLAKTAAANRTRLASYAERNPV